MLQFLETETGVKFYNKQWYEPVPKQVENVQEGKVTISWNEQEPSPTINRTSYSVIMKKAHVC